MTITDHTRVSRSKSGVLITDEVADQLAQEAERGYEPSELRRVGRKSLAGGSGRSPRVNYRMTPDLHERALARAQREGKTLSALAREALERYVETPES
jgi:predicted HicB family RNase H-like nuclease